MEASIEVTGRMRSREIHERLLALGRDALEGRRSLSELLGSAFAELRSAVELVRELEAGASPSVLSNGGSPPAPARPDGDRTATAPVGATARVGTGTSVLEPGPAAGSSGGDASGLLAKPMPSSEGGLEAALSERLAGALYLGSLVAGDRLPSIRELARRTGLNHKVVRRVYRRLERCGLVEVRDRSGIYVAGSESDSGWELDARGEWLAGIVEQSIGMGVAARDLPGLLASAVAARPLRCLCVDPVEDDRLALAEEVAARFGLQARAVAALAACAAEDTDLIVTTPFHAEEVRRAVRDRVPVLVARLHPAWRETILAAREEAPLRLLCVDAAAGERLRRSAGPELAERVEAVVLDAAQPRSLGPQSPDLATAAATAALGVHSAEAGLVVLPYLCAGSVRGIARLLVQLNRPRAR